MLYHYTSQNGFLGIIQSSCVWATHTRFLNDSSEFLHGLSFAKNFAGSIFMEDDYLGAFGWALRHALESVSGDNIYVSSYSEVPDLLSQWRGYCPNGAGFCVGFSDEVLKDYCHQNGYRLEKCIYKHEEQIQKIQSLIDKCFEQFPQPHISREVYDKYSPKEQAKFELDYRLRTSEGSEANQANEAVKWFCDEITELAPLLKNEGFHEEVEWRVIIKEPKTGIMFRAGKSFLIPYMELRFLEDSKLRALMEVIVGPNPNQHRNEASARMYLDSVGLNETNIESSKTPYNNW